MKRHSWSKAVELYFNSEMINDPNNSHIVLLPTEGGRISVFQGEPDSRVLKGFVGNPTNRINYRLVKNSFY